MRPICQKTKIIITKTYKNNSGDPSGDPQVDPPGDPSGDPSGDSPGDPSGDPPGDKKGYHTVGSIKLWNRKTTVRLSLNETKTIKIEYHYFRLKNISYVENKQQILKNVHCTLYNVQSILYSHNFKSQHT